MHKVLIVTCGYPPGHLVGYERIIKFEKFLPSFGYQTSILTTGSFDSLPSDREKRVYRAFEPGQFYRPLIRFLIHFLKRPTGIINEKSQAVQPRGGILQETSLLGAR